jgi:hypothetical protein
MGRNVATLNLHHANKEIFFESNLFSEIKHSVGHMRLSTSLLEVGTIGIHTIKGKVVPVFN